MLAIARTPVGGALLWGVAIGLLALCVSGNCSRRCWCRDGTGPAGGRAASRSSRRRLAYAVVGGLALVFALGGRPSAAETGYDVSATLIAVPGGAWLLIAIGLVTLGVGIGFVVAGVRRRFRRLLRMPSGAGRVVTVVGVAGYVGKGIALGVVGVLVVIGAAMADPRAASGLDGALTELVTKPYGEILVWIAGGGLIALRRLLPPARPLRPPLSAADIRPDPNRAKVRFRGGEVHFPRRDSKIAGFALQIVGIRKRSSITRTTRPPFSISSYGDLPPPRRPPPNPPVPSSRPPHRKLSRHSPPPYPPTPCPPASPPHPAPPPPASTLLTTCPPPATRHSDTLPPPPAHLLATLTPLPIRRSAARSSATGSSRRSPEARSQSSTTPSGAPRPTMTIVGTPSSSASPNLTPGETFGRSS